MMPITFFNHQQNTCDSVIDRRSQFFAGCAVQLQGFWFDGFRLGQAFNFCCQGLKRSVQVVKGLVQDKLGFRLKLSQFAPPVCDLVRGAFALQRGRVPLRLYTHNLTASMVITGATRNSPVPKKLTALLLSSGCFWAGGKSGARTRRTRWRGCAHRLIPIRRAGIA